MSKTRLNAGTVLDRINHIFVLFSIALIVFALLAVCADVTIRYVTPHPLLWVQEVTNYVLVYITFLSAAWVLKKDMHVRVDLFLNRLSSRGRALLNAVDSALGALISLTIVLAGGYVTIDYFQRGVPSVELLATPMYLVIGIIPLGSLFLFIQYIRTTRGYISQFKTLQTKVQ